MPLALLLVELDIALDTVLGDFLSERGPGDAQQLCGLRQIALGLFERFDDQLRLHLLNELLVGAARGAFQMLPR